MSRSRLVSMFVALAATLIFATGAQASPSQATTISVVTSFNGSDPFTATGGVVCATGTVSNSYVNFRAWQSNTGAQILIVKDFVCGESSFSLLLRVSLDFATCDTVGTWSVLSGTGAYTKLHGAGTLTGDSACGDTILDFYTGSMHID
jgi:hypothetical protein